MHEIFSRHVNTPADVQQYIELAKAFKKPFADGCSKGGGINRENVTPYIHIVCDHFPAILGKVGGDLRRFSGEATEALCKLARNAFRNSNHQDPEADVIIRKRLLEFLKDFAKAPRQYAPRQLADITDRPKQSGVHGPAPAMAAAAMVEPQEPTDDEVADLAVTADLLAEDERQGTAGEEEEVRDLEY